MNEQIRICADYKLKRKYKREVNEDGEKEKPWFTKEISNIMNKRKFYNRLVRNGKK